MKSTASGILIALPKLSNSEWQGFAYVLFSIIDRLPEWRGIFIYFAYSVNQF